MYNFSYEFDDIVPLAKIMELTHIDDDHLAFSSK